MLKRTATTSATIMSLLSFAFLVTLLVGCGEDKQAKAMASKYRIEIATAKNQVSALAAETSKSQRENERLTLQIKRQTDEITHIRGKLTTSEQALKALRTEYDALLAEKKRVKTIS